MRLSLGIIIAIILLVYWWMKDHPQPAEPPRQSYLTIQMAAV